VGSALAANGLGMSNFEDRFLYVSRQIDATKPGSRVKVILIFIDYAKHPVLLGIRVIKGLVDFAKLERLFMALVADADHVPLPGLHDFEP
jgi:hypothetical protein